MEGTGSVLIKTHKEEILSCFHHDHGEKIAGSCMDIVKRPTIKVLIHIHVPTDKQNALRRECTFKIEIVLEIGVAGVNIYLKITVLTLSGVVARLAQSVRPWRIFIDFY